jgi:hypothetical protein
MAKKRKLKNHNIPLNIKPVPGGIPAKLKAEQQEKREKDRQSALAEIQSGTEAAIVHISKNPRILANWECFIAEAPFESYQGADSFEVLNSFNFSYNRDLAFLSDFVDMVGDYVEYCNLTWDELHQRAIYFFLASLSDEQYELLETNPEGSLLDAITFCRALIQIVEPN